MTTEKEITPAPKTPASAPASIDDGKMQVTPDAAPKSAAKLPFLKAQKTDDLIEDPRKIIRFGMFVILFLFGGLGFWASVAEMSGAVVGMGKVKVESERKTVAHLEGGIVEAILVRDGDEVKAGQTLVIMESSQVNASVDLYRKQLYANLATLARLKAEKDWKDEVVWPDELLNAKELEVKEILDNENKIFLTRQDAVKGQIALLTSQIQQIKAQISGFEEQSKSERVIIDTLEEELKAKRQLFDERYLEKSQILELERQLASHKGNRGRLQQSVAETRQRRSELELRIVDMKNRFVEEATTQLGRVENEILQIRDRIRPLLDAKQRLHVVAPVSGRVVGLKIHSAGGVVRAGDPMMDIVPDDTPLIVEMQVPVNKVSDVYIGQEAQAQLDAFDTRLNTLIKGKVIYISPDRHEEQTNMGPQPFYRAHIQLDPKSLEDAKLYISPGMPVTVFITTKSRTVLMYMIEPLIKNWQRSLRE